MAVTRVFHWTPKAVVFDCDGTLLDSERHWRVARSQTLAAYHLTVGDHFAERASGVHYVECGRLMAQEAGCPQAAEELAAHLLNGFQELAAARPVVLPGVPELVANVGAFAPLAVASNCPRSVVESSLEAADLLRYFRYVAVAEDTVRPKPHPDTYLAAVGRCGVATAETLAVEDSRAGVEAARAAGMRVLGVGLDPDPTLRERADAWVDSLDVPEVQQWAAARVPRPRSASRANQARGAAGRPVGGEDVRR